MARTEISRKRIAIVADAIPPVGGGVAAVQHHLFRLFKKAGHDVRAFGYDTPAGHDGNDPDVVCRRVPGIAKKAASVLVPNLFRFLDHGKVAYQTREILEVQLGAARLNGPLRQFRPDILIVPDHGSPALALNAIPGCTRILVSQHNPFRFLGEVLFGAHSEKDARLAVWLEQKALARIDRVVVSTNYMKNEFTETYRFDGPVSVIPNLIDEDDLTGLEDLDVREGFGVPSETTAVYIPSAGSKFKGARYVFEIVRRLAARCGDAIVFYLSGDINRELRRELSFLPANAKIFAPGRVDYRKNLAYVKSCSFTVSPTLIENFSMAMLEGNFLGLPVVSFDVGGNPEFIVEGENGFLVALLDVERLVEQAARLLDPKLLSRSRKETLISVRKRFDSDLWLDQWLVAS